MENSIASKLKGMPKSIVSDRKPMIIGHRGAMGVAPQNTLPAFEAALEGGADGVEFDVQRTIDGHLVLFHDEDLAPTTNGEGTIMEITLQELQALDAGSSFDVRFRNTRVLSLVEFFEWARGNDLLLFLEMKEPFRYPGIEQEIADLIRAYDLVNRVQVRSFHHPSLHEFNKIAPEIAISELWRNNLPCRDEVVYSTLNLESGLFHEQHIKQFHDLGCAVTVWVVDDLDYARQLADWGVDGITTNDPACLARMFDEPRS